MQRLGGNSANRKPRFGEAAAESTSEKGKFVTQKISDRFIFCKVFQDVTTLTTWTTFLPKSGVQQKKQKISYVSLQLLWQSHSLAMSIQLPMKPRFLLLSRCCNWKAPYSPVAIEMVVTSGRQASGKSGSSDKMLN